MKTRASAGKRQAALAAGLLAGLFVSAWIAAAAAAKKPTGADGKIDFNRQIRPILSDNCFACHGPDEKARKAKLRLDRKEDAFKPAKSGDYAIVPGDLAKSKLVERIKSQDPDEVMPPPKSGKKLTPQQMELLTRWVAQGAMWQDHWAFAKPERPPRPPVKDARWPRNDIDRFILARLEKESLKPSPEADKTALARRVSYDLTGLPPTPQEVDAFLADKSPDAYEKLVDRLLDSPRFGEHQARYWLDAARYADSHGYHIDAERSMWKWRDWVIQAFNDNLPFDQFTTWQLAGDLLPEATLDQKVASGYVRANMSTGEGGAIEDEYQCKYTFDRVETSGTIWLGLTLTCARCHTHKYDPIQQREYYGLYAFFNSLNESVMDGNKPNPDPFLRVPTPEQARRQTELKQLIADAEAKLARPMPELDQALADWQAKWHERLSGGWTTLQPSTLKSAGGAQLRTLDDRSVLAAGTNADSDVYEVTAPLAAGNLAAIRLEVLPHESLPNKSSARAADGRFRLSEFDAELLARDQEGKPGKPKKLKFTQALADAAEASFEIAKAIDGKADTGWGVDAAAATEPHTALFALAEPMKVSAGSELRVSLRFEASKSKRAIGHFRLAAAQNDSLVQLLNPPKPEPWHLLGPFKTDGLRQGFAAVFAPEKEIDLQKTYAGARDEIRWAAKPDFADGLAHLLVNELHGVHGAYYLFRTVEVPAPRQVEVSLRADDLFKLWVNDKLVVERATPAKPGEGPLKVSVDLAKGRNKFLVKIVNHQGACYFTFRSDLGGGADSVPADIATLLATAKKLTGPQQARVRDFFRRQHSPEIREWLDNVARWREEDAGIEKTIPTTLVAKEMDTPRDTVMLVRGEYDKKGDKVAPGVPAILPPLPPDAPTNRLGLARWLLDPAHPLTARVTVNRFWQQFFGVGLVKTTEDFGMQGEPPSHPELLDWLATEFIRAGWDVKRLQRLLVTSATYRQTAKASPELRARDPENRLLARGPRFRLDGEALRDTALFLGGLLSDKLGGRSARPYEPAGLWEAVSFNNSQKYVQDAGEGNYRRSVYTHWKRQSPPPNMLIFDAPTREYCVVRRPRTNTPLQALVLLNDPQFVEAARGFAQRIMKEGGRDPRSRIAWAFRLATARPPTADEAKVLLDAFNAQLADFRRDKAAAEKLLAVGGFKADASLDPSELAAWATIASMILNLDETVTKG